MTLLKVDAMFFRHSPRSFKRKTRVVSMNVFRTDDKRIMSIKTVDMFIKPRRVTLESVKWNSLSQSDFG